jgi:glycosyltransferase involved in cell wall biosynthesis
MAQPLVSVILPVRNGGKYLRSAVDSILAQTLGDLELLVIDDHSSDGAVAALDRSDRRLKVTGNQGRGLVDAFATGQARAKGAFIARMDADDLACPHRLAEQVAYLESNPGVDIAGGCVQFFSEGVIGEGTRRYQRWLNSVRSPEDIHAQIFIESPIPNPTAMFRPAALGALGGYRRCTWPEDYDLFLRADRAGMAMGKPDGVVLEWRDHPHRLTRTDPLYARERFQRAKAHYLAHGRLPPKPVLIWGAGPTGRRMHDLLAAEGVATAGFIEVHPRRVGGRKRGRPVYGIGRAVAGRAEFILVAVGARGARAKIRKYLARHGRREGEDHLFVA